MWNLLSTGDGLDWSGLPLAAAWLGIDDIEDLVHRLYVIKTHRPPRDGPTPEE